MEKKIYIIFKFVYSKSLHPVAINIPINSNIWNSIIFQFTLITILFYNYRKIQGITNHLYLLQCVQCSDYANKMIKQFNHWFKTLVIVLNFLHHSHTLPDGLVIDTTSIKKNPLLSCWVMNPAKLFLVACMSLIISTGLCLSKNGNVL